MPDSIASLHSLLICTPIILLELGTQEATNIMLLTQLALSSSLTKPSYTKLHLAIVLNWKSGDRLNGLSWPNILSAKGSRRTHIMRNTWHTLSPMGYSMEAGRVKKRIVSTIPLNCFYLRLEAAEIGCC